jgi:hypothetical protein
MAKSFYSSSKSNHNQGFIPKVNPFEPRPFEELPSLHSPQEEENKQPHNSQQSPSPSHNDLSQVSIFAPSNSIQTQLTEKSPQNQEIQQKNNSKTNFSQSPPISPFPPNTPNNQNFQNNSIIQGYYGENNPNSPIQRKRFNIPATSYIDPYAVINKSNIISSDNNLENNDQISQQISDQQETIAPIVQLKFIDKQYQKNNKSEKLAFFNNTISLPNLQLKEVEEQEDKNNKSETIKLPNEQKLSSEQNPNQEINNPKNEELEKSNSVKQNSESNNNIAPFITPQNQKETQTEAKTNPQEEQKNPTQENKPQQTPPNDATGDNNKGNNSKGVGNKGGSVKGGVSGGGVTKAPNSPESDPAFQGVVSKAKGVATEKKEHDPASAEAKEAQDAAQSPQAELKGKAQDQKVGEMEGQKPGTFNATAFKNKILEKIKAITPTTENEAKEFKNNNKINDVKNQVSSQVSDEKKNAADPIENKVKEQPDPSSIKPKDVTPLEEPDKGNLPGEIGAQQAAPKPKTESEVNAPLQENSQNIDQQMAEADLTDEQLEKSNEPQFLETLNAKKQAQDHAQTAPNEYRQQEQGVLNKAQGEAQNVTQTGLTGMHSQKENILNQVLGKQEDTKGKDEEKRTEIGNQINSIYEQTKGEVEKSLADLDSKVNIKFDHGANRAKKLFEDYVGKKMDAYKQERYGEWYDVTKYGNRIRDTFKGLPPEVNQFFVEGRELYINEMDVALTEIAQLVADKLNEAKQKITEGKQKIQEYVTSLPENLQQIGKEAADNIQTKFDELEQSVDNKESELVDSLVGKYQENLQAVDAKIEEMKKQNQGLFDKAKDAIKGTWETIKNLKDMLMGVLKSAGDVVGKIIKDPIGFLGNLISGVKQGFDNFLGNIMTHLQGGLIGWLTGTMGAMGITIPDDLFSLKGIFSLVTQVLGLTWNYIRSKAVKMFTEPVVSAMEKGSEIFQLLQTGGLEGVWEYIQDQFTDLKESIIDEIKNMVITQVITAGVKWILSLLNPASAFVKAAMAIYDIVMFFVNRGSQVIELVKAVTESISAIASGAVGQVASAIEGALAKSLPVVIGFMASLLGIGGLVGKVQNVIKKIKSRIDKAIETVLKKAKKAAKKLLSKLGLGKKNKKGKEKKEKQDNSNDQRTKEEKQADLDKAINESEKLIMVEDATPSSVKPQLSQIKSKYKLKSLVLVENNDSMFVEGEVNPKGKTKPKKLPKIDLTELKGYKPSWRVSTDKKLAKQYSQYYNEKGKKQKGVDRRHIVAFEVIYKDLKSKIHEKTYSEGATILNNLGYTPKKPNKDSILVSSKAYLRDKYNDHDNVWVGDSKENQKKGSEMGRLIQKLEKLQNQMRSLKGNSQSIQQQRKQITEEIGKVVDELYDAKLDPATKKGQIVKKAKQEYQEMLDKQTERDRQVS